MARLLSIWIPASAFAAYVVACVVAAAAPLSRAGLALEVLRSGEAFVPSALVIYLVVSTAARAALDWTPARSGLAALGIAAAWAGLVFVGAVGSAVQGAGGGHPGSPGALEDAFYFPERLIVKPIEALTAPLRRRHCVQALAGPQRQGAQEELCAMGARALDVPGQLALIRLLQQDTLAQADPAALGAPDRQTSAHLRRCLLAFRLEAPEVIRQLESAAADRASADEQGREDAIRMLARAGDGAPEILSTLLAVADQDGSRTVRRAALEAAITRASGDPRIEPACVAAMARGDTAGALGLLAVKPGDRRVARAYAERLRSADAALRLAWLRSLVEPPPEPDDYGDGAATGRLRRLRETLAEADPADLDLRRALKDAVNAREPDVVRAAAWATVEIFQDGAECAALLARLLGHASPDVREEAARLVGRGAVTWPDDALFEAMLKAMAESGSPVFPSAVGTLLQAAAISRSEGFWRPTELQLARLLRLGARRPDLFGHLASGFEQAMHLYRDRPSPALDEALTDALSSPAVDPHDARFEPVVRLHAGLVAAARSLGHKEERLQVAVADQIGFGARTSADAPEPSHDVCNVQIEAKEAVRSLRPYAPRTVARLEALAASPDREVARQARSALEKTNDD